MARPFNQSDALNAPLERRSPTSPPVKEPRHFGRFVKSFHAGGLTSALVQLTRPARRPAEGARDANKLFFHLAKVALP